MTSTHYYLHLHMLVSMLLALPIMYFLISYVYLARWHNKVLLWNTLIHENGRLTLVGSLFYFDHFIGCVPMIIVFALCTVGGFALANRSLSVDNPSRVVTTGIVMLGVAAFLLAATLAASVITVGRKRTIDYACQRIERDGVMSTGGNWNQFQLSNIPIAFGTIGASSSLVIPETGFDMRGAGSMAIVGWMSIGMAFALLVGISAYTFPGWQSFLNPRWIAHSIRELATYPLTGIPISLASIVLVEHSISGLDTWLIKPRPVSLVLLGTAILILIGQLRYLHGVGVVAMAQRPPFARGGLSIPYLLFSHVFEHFLDFIFIAPLAGGLYALVRWLSLTVNIDL